MIAAKREGDLEFTYLYVARTAGMATLKPIPRRYDTVGRDPLRRFRLGPAAPSIVWD